MTVSRELRENDALMSTGLMGGALSAMLAALNTADAGNIAGAMSRYREVSSSQAFIDVFSTDLNAQQTPTVASPDKISVKSDLADYSFLHVAASSAQQAVDLDGLLGLNLAVMSDQSVMSSIPDFAPSAPYVEGANALAMAALDVCSLTSGAESAWFVVLADAQVPPALHAAP